jgi:hypothetical protein
MIDIFKFAEEKDVELLYATRFGSHLYGTATANSDLDVKGIFLPTKRDLLLQGAPDQFSFHSGNDNDRNTKDDVDVELYSLHNFLRMCERGDTGALDLLFSFTNKDAPIYCNPKYNSIINNIEYLINPLNTRAFIGYCIGQSKKYSLKGARLRALDNLIDYINGEIYKKQENREDYWEHFKEVDDVQLETYIDKILKNCACGAYVMEDFVEVHAKSTQKIRAIRVLGSVHLQTITMNEFKRRLVDLQNKYGERAKKARDNDSIDYKALSHAYRVALQSEELITTGKITFPLKDAQIIREIKIGYLTMNAIADLIETQVEKVDTLLQKPELLVENKFNKQTRDKLILEFYGN